VNRSIHDVYTELYRDQFIIDVLVVVECILFALWQAMVYVPGFPIYTVAPSVVVSTGWGHTVSHLGCWAIIEFFVIAIGLRTSKFVLPPPPIDADSPRLRFSLGRAKTWCIAHFVALLLGAVADVADIVLTGLELGDAESTCYFDSKGFLIAFLIVLILQLVFVKVPLLYCVFEYRRHLVAVTSTTDGSASSIKKQLLDVTPSYTGSSTAAAEAVRERLRTPLLQQQPLGRYDAKKQ